METLPEGSWPPVGVNTGAQLSYEGLGLKESDFVLAEESDLRTLLAGYVAKCDHLTVFGMTYSDGTGIHDAQMNAGQNRMGRWCSTLGRRTMALWLDGYS